MFVQLLSDLHLEHQPGIVPAICAYANVVVLAGDIGSYQFGSLLDADDFGLSRFSPQLRGVHDQMVLYVPGNHEFDALDYDRTRDRLKQICQDVGITWLDREVVTVQGVRFVGTTLWSDFDALGSAQETFVDELRARQEAIELADTYLRQNTMLRFGSPVLAAEMRLLALDCQDWLHSVLAKDFNGKTVVVTHFAPSLRSADPRFGITARTAGFCNSLDKLISRSDIWMHGHVHCHHDYEVKTKDEAGRQRSCRVFANPFGYPHETEQKFFRNPFVLSI